MPFFEGALRDLRFALRSFGKDRVWTATVLVTLTLGIGVSTATFSVVNAVLLNPLPYKDSDRIVMLWAVNEEAGYTLEQQREQIGTLSPAELEDWKEQSGIFEDLVYFRSYWWDFVENGNPGRVFGYQASEGVFRMLGVQPMLGRFFRPEDHDPAGEPVVVLLYECWRTHFRGDPGIIGKRLPSGSTISTVIGVAPPEFTFYKRGVDILVAGSWAPDRRTNRWFRAIGLLKPGLSGGTAQNRAEIFSGNLAREYPDSNKGWEVRIVPLLEESAGRFRPALLVLFGATCFVLLAMSFNVANLFLARAAARNREIAVRSAIGAGRGRLIRQLLTESFCLSVCGAVLGLALAVGLVRYLRTLFPERTSNWAQQVVQLESIQVDAAVAMFACAAAILTGLIFGVLPALAASRPNLTVALKEFARGSGMGVAGRNRARTLVVAQVAVTTVLVLGAGLLVRSVLRLYGDGPGFRSSGLLLTNVAMDRERMLEIRREAKAAGLTQAETWERFRAAQISFRARILETLASVPGVESATAAGRIPMRPQTRMFDAVIPGRPPEEPAAAVLEEVEPNYFQVMGIPLINGRAFGYQDRPDSRRVAVINEEMARRTWPGEEVLGKRLTFFREMELEVVGVVGNTRPNGLGTEPPPFVYIPSTQSARGGGVFIVRTAGDPALFISSLRQAIERDNPANPTRLLNTVALDELVGYSAWQINFSALLLGGLAGLSLLLAAVGLYGVMSYSVRGSIREIGIRLALGARAAEIRSRVVRRGVVLVLLGLIPGLLLASGLTRYLGSLLYGVEPLDAITMAAVVSTFLVAAVAASYVPARRASRVDPIEALRHE